MTTTPRIDTELTSSRMASTAAPSPPSLSPRPTQRPAAMAPASVTRTNSRARLRSGASRRDRDEPLARRASDAVMSPIVPEASRRAGAGILAPMTTQPQPGSDVAGPAARGSDVAGPAAPAPRPAKPRLLQDGRDMFWSIAPLVLACIVLAGMLGMCSFQPAGPGKGQIPTFDAAAALRADAATLGFPVRLPQLPEGWHANSGDRGGI